MIVSLLFLASLAIDSGVLSASRTQHRQTAELLALRSLREFISAGGTPMSRLLVAREKAQQLLGIDVFLGQPFRSDPSLTDEIGPLDSSLASGPSGNIVPGIWHFRPELDSGGLCVGASNGCPCTPSNQWNGPCFEPIDFALASNFDVNGELIQPINAFRAEYKLRSDSPLKAIFARIKGDVTFSIESNATAAVVPTHGIFLLDLSRSSHLETHLPYERVGTTTPGSNPSEGAYKITNKTCPADHSNPCTSATPPACDFEGGLYPGLYSAIYNSTGPVIIKSNRSTNPAAARTFRFKSDYSCYTIHYAPGDAGDNYLVDTYRGGTSSNTVVHDGPEPMTTMLDAVSHASELIYARNIPGDRLGLIGFDERADLIKRRIEPAVTGSPDFQKLQRVTDVSLVDHDSDHDSTNDAASARLRERIEDSLLFTRVDGAANIPSALDQARLMLLNSNDPVLSENFVVLISDGVANCIDTDNDPTTPSVCGRDQNTYVGPSIDRSVDLITNEFVPAHIKFHMINIGDIGLPHTVLRRGSTPQTADQCMGDEESRDKQADFVDLGSPLLSDPTGLKNAIMSKRTTPPTLTAPYFYYANKFYNAVRATGGVWAPVRTPCVPNGTVALPSGATCSQGGLKDALDAQCKAQATQGAIVPGIPQFTDSSGRLACDIYCRSKREQVHAAVDSMFDRPPLLLVE